jgi:hypothetical protein
MAACDEVIVYAAELTALSLYPGQPITLAYTVSLAATLTEVPRVALEVGFPVVFQ